MGKASTSTENTVQMPDIQSIPDKPKRKRRFGDRYDGDRVRDID